MRSTGYAVSATYTVNAGSRNAMIAPHGWRSIPGRTRLTARSPAVYLYAAFICFTTSSTLIVPAGKALLMTCVNTSFGLPCMTWIGMPK